MRYYIHTAFVQYEISKYFRENFFLRLWTLLRTLTLGLLLDGRVAVISIQPLDISQGPYLVGFYVPRWRRFWFDNKVTTIVKSDALLFAGRSEISYNWRSRTMKIVTKKGFEDENS